MKASWMVGEWLNWVLKAQHTALVSNVQFTRQQGIYDLCCIGGACKTYLKRQR